jgi:hypothetical protein
VNPQAAWQAVSLFESRSVGANHQPVWRVQWPGEQSPQRPLLVLEIIWDVPLSLYFHKSALDDVSSQVYLYT